MKKIFPRLQGHTKTFQFLILYKVSKYQILKVYTTYINVYFVPHKIHPHDQTSLLSENFVTLNKFDPAPYFREKRV